MKTKLTCFLTLTLVLLMQITFAQNQTTTINGTVSDEDGMPVPAVNIVIEGTDQGTATDFNGQYTIEAAVGQVLKFTAIGFDDQSITVGMQSQIDVTMVQGNILDDVIITAFGRKMTRNESTSSVVTVGSADLEKSPFVDVQQALQGRVTGMTIAQTSGAPGAPAEVRIRGMNSITASNSPLYVIDGVPVFSGGVAGSSESTSLDMTALLGNLDIESVTVLKDASAVAPYGADGSNGVILITTKSGKKGRVSYNLAYTTGFQNRARKGVKMMNGEEKYESSALGFINGGLIPDMDAAQGFMYGALPGYAQWYDLGQPGINWSDEVSVKDALMTNASFSVSQGNETSSLYTSVGFNKTEGTVIGSDFKRVTGSFKYSTDLNDKLNVQISGNVSNVDQDGVLEKSAYFSNPNLSRYFLSPWASPYLEDGSYNIGDAWDAGSSMHNTLYTARKNMENNNVTRALQNTRVTYDILDNLTFTSVLGLDYTLSYVKRYTNPIHGDGEDVNGNIQETSSRFFKYTTQNSLDYRFQLEDKHNFIVSAVQEFSKYKLSGLMGYGENLPNEFMHNLSSTSANFAASSTFSDQMSQRYVGLLSYNFDKKYLLDASYSYQGDSRFSKKFGNFYSIGLGWNIHQENFLLDSDVVDELRLRAGHGVTGNAGIGRNLYQSLKGYGSYRDMPAGVVAEYGTVATWEKSERYDVGVEFGLFNRRLNGTVGYYMNETKDMLFNVPLPLSSQYTGGSVLQNVGSMTNTGLELELNGDIISTDDFTWNLGGNFTTLANKVTYLPEDAETIQSTWVLQKDRKIYEWYMKEWAGVDAETGDALWYVNRETNGDETTTNYSEADQMYQGTSRLPKYNGSIMTRFDYKNFFLEGQLYFAGGHKIFQNWASYVQSTDIGQNLGMNSSHAAYAGAWRQPGDEATYPRFDYGSTNIENAASASTRWLHDGDFMRLRDIAFGYSFDRDQLKGTFLDGVTLSVRGTNLWTWVKDKNLEYDPEVETGIGFTNLTTPPIKTVTFNVNLKF